MDQEKFERQMEFMLATQAKHDVQIQGLIRVAELHQTNLERQAEELKASRAQWEAGHAQWEARHAQWEAEQKKLDDRVNALVSAMGEWIRRTSPPSQPA